MMLHVQRKVTELKYAIEILKWVVSFRTQQNNISFLLSINGLVVLHVHHYFEIGLQIHNVIKYD